VTLQGKESIVQILECAIVAAWNDLVRGPQAGLIHIEYQLTPGGTLDYLKVWSSTSRGHWFLACEYWMSGVPLHGSGIHFHNGYASEGLAHILDFVMQHQSAFSPVGDFGRHGLLQIPTPTQEVCVTAAASVSEALNREDPTLGKCVAA